MVGSLASFGSATRQPVTHSPIAKAIPAGYLSLH
jgi:hypothetical protein